MKSSVFFKKITSVRTPMPTLHDVFRQFSSFYLCERSPKIRPINEKTKKSFKSLLSISLLNSTNYALLSRKTLKCHFHYILI